ncbi:penicillin-binding protein activator [uncultured Tateyamaria sp.]|uniref:penicillin-binding protein activator n=1 Tax=Tateyamaria sp. 1078 TaxID=3417464 RepID=UPI00262044D3|nr:penicillin-binding protein activator [uncultured Tateyamaria sp.]
MLGALPIAAGCTAQSGPLSRQRKLDDAARVVLLLPLSGNRAALGQQMAKAVWLVEDLAGLAGQTQIVDAGDTADMAARATRNAVAQGANIIVGPLFRDQTPAVVQAAGTAPVLSLSNDATLAASGAWVFGVTPAQSVDTVLRFAKDSGARRMAVLQTNGALGQRAVDAVTAGARNARVTALPVVPAATRPGQLAEALQRTGGGTLPDILYVPGTSATALKQAEAAVQTGVTTIGSLQWSGLDQPQLNRLDKACFTGPDPVRFNRLSAFFRAQLEEEMGVIAALAVDAVGLAHAAGGTSHLSHRTPYEGLLGDTRFERDRRCVRRLAILRIDGGDVLPVA